MTNIIPLWVVLGLIVAAMNATQYLVQERFKVNGFAVAVWCKVACVIVTLPVVVVSGVPDDPVFYALALFQSAMFAIADVNLFRSIAVVGSGAISRLMPLSLMGSFLLWFAVEPSLIDKYMATPWISAGILAAIAGTMFFAMRLRRCEVSLRAAKMIWFNIVASTIGTVVAMMIVQRVGQEYVFAYIFISALMMLSFWAAYVAARRPFPVRDLVARHTVKGGLSVGTAQAVMLVVALTAYFYVDNPAYISALSLTRVLMIIAVHRFWGVDDQSNVRAGLGILACAVALVLLKEQM